MQIGPLCAKHREHRQKPGTVIFWTCNLNRMTYVEQCHTGYYYSTANYSSDRTVHFINGLFDLPPEGKMHKKKLVQDAQKKVGAVL